ncbi:unnamed protein product [Blepharisma stoltei]|uniref:Methyltransferase domain-containing protein n=1 Tax=Blepharisma stoltei TaxID=1481888 RepID=A0AAU9IGX8_9CILI|nr:unnamed protein product [Blepharisma stoltei]
MSTLEDIYNSNAVHWESYARQPGRYLCEYFTIFKNISPTGNGEGQCLSNMRILDLGCGNGDISIESLRRGAKFAVGIDFAENLLSRAREIANEAGFMESHYSFIKANAFQSETVFEQLPLETHRETFDVVFLLWILDYSQTYEDFKRLIQLAASYLKPGGTLMILENNHAVATNTEEVNKKNKFGDWVCSNPTWNVDHWQIENTYIDPQTQRRNYTEHLEIFTKEQYQEALQLAGLTLEKFGPLELDPRYSDLGFQESDFCCLTEEIGAYYHYKGVKH